MKVAFVVPRYGPQVNGGAENAARALAEHLASGPAWDVEVFTTCAVDAMTWHDELRPGTEDIGGVVVHRFLSQHGRDGAFHDYSGPLLARVDDATPDEASRWIDLQGPICPEVVTAAVDSDADIVAFYPYLYYPTVRGLPLVGGRGVLHAAAHDEAPIRLPVFDEVFKSAAGLVFHTYGERRLVHHLFDVAQQPQIVLGLGVDPGAGDAHVARDELGIGDRPYLCCVGRVDDQKGCGTLWRFFVAHKERHPGPLALVLAGQVVDRPPDHSDLIVPGPISEATKWGLMAGSLALVSPSAMESFSLVVVEAWLSGVPVLVNGRCAATVEQCVRSGGGLWYSRFAEFDVAVSRLMSDRRLGEGLARRGRRFVDANFRWPVVLERYQRFLEAVDARHRRAGVPV